ncbi:RecQ family ATP-dependent DNA helicase [uncultured Prevotella sp.]|jgi:ATP-dependent DNA helicase RecQ|uniref:RecQ family ATP-dependent DNA helicase n=1 Tax=uncultured Prevotella sp. TaxID=159272 RepID=UPI0025880FCC|nr:RecQ family ATP-dependent DNA helicase [uncultured Prevotella sp.]
MDNENNAPNNCQLSIVNYQSLLKKYWGYDDFRGIQKEIIESIGAGKDTLGLMPTGGGKSITFQVPALAHEGVCIVITPLIALMKDQVSNLRRRGIQASAIYSGMKHDSILMTLENAVFGGVKILYISPERISTSLFLEKLRHMKVSFICVDEAHCISQWGYDFRPSYLSIADIRKELPDTPVLALTATATPEVIDDIQERLHFREKCVYKMSFARKNLAYVVRHTSNKTGQLIHILNHVQGSAIVYVRSRKRTKEYAELLNTSGISATFYHAGLDNQEKDQRQKAWQEDKVRVMVATNAFGMGIDKPDVRVVIHIDCPDCLEAYFQEAGRAGRDGKKSYAVLLYDNNDRSKLQRRVVDTFPDKDFIRQVYDQLAYFYQIGVGSGYNACFEFPLERFCRIYKHFPIPTVSALNILTRAGYIDFKEEDDMQARVMFSVERDDLYKLRGNEPQEDAVIVALLRNYTGLFQGYQYIDEGVIAEQCGLTQPQVYMTLRALTQKHILDFIPQKHIPFIRYTQRREESERLVISKSIYDDLKIRFAERIEKMLEYANSGNICRSRMLLRYFGETNTEDCGQCDVCLNEKRSWTPPESQDGQ